MNAKVRRCKKTRAEFSRCPRVQLCSISRASIPISTHIRGAHLFYKSISYTPISVPKLSNDVRPNIADLFKAGNGSRTSPKRLR